MKFSHQYIIESSTGTETVINGRQYLYFGGTGYLQLHSHPEILKTASEAVLRYGMTPATSRAITGTSSLLVEMEKKAAGYFQTEDAAYLPSGYLTNIAGLKALHAVTGFDLIFLDEDAHYCLAEGALTVGKPIVTFRNRDAEDLEKKLQKHLKTDQKPLIASDGLFPIRAQLAPVDAYLKLAEKYNGFVWVDDAHAVGILGANGRGTYEYFKLSSSRLFMGATLSKAFGTYGGIIPGNSEFIKQVKTGSVMTGSSSPVHAVVAAGIKGLEIAVNNPQLRSQLRENALYLKAKLRSIGMQCDDNDLPIVAFVPGNADTMKRFHEMLMDRGIFIQYANYKGSGRNGILRLVVFATHTKEQIDILAQKMAEVSLELNLHPSAF